MKIKPNVFIVAAIIMFAVLMGIQDQSLPTWLLIVLSTCAGVCFMLSLLLSHIVRKDQDKKNRNSFDVFLKTITNKKNSGFLFSTIILFVIMMVLRYELHNWYSRALLAGCAFAVLALGGWFVTNTGSKDS